MRGNITLHIITTTINFIRQNNKFYSAEVGNNTYDKKAVLLQRWPRNAPYTWVPWKFSGLLTMPTAIIPYIFHGLMFGSTLWMFLQNLKSVALPVPEIIGGTQQNLGSPWIRLRSLFSKIFNRLLFGLALYMYPWNLKSVALPVPEIRGGS